MHNIRIERLWVDVGNGWARKWVDFFHDLEDRHGLNVELDSHIWLLHYLFLEPLNQDAMEWAEAWNHHSLRLPRGEKSGRSPCDLYLFGLAQNGLRGFDQQDPAFDEDPQNYGVDWYDMNDQGLVGNLLEQRPAMAPEEPANNNVFLMNPPPRFSRVTVDPPGGHSFDDQEMEQLQWFMTQRVDVNRRDMDSRRTMWTLALRFCMQSISRHE